MGLSPQEMGDAIVRNLKAKTGRTLEEWLIEIKEITYHDKKEFVAYLKHHYGLGHFQAQTIFQASIKGDAKSLRTYDEKSLFNSSTALELYTATRQSIERISTDIICKPCKTYIPFYVKHKFAQIKPTRGDDISVEVYLPKGSDSSKTKPIIKQKDKMTHSIIIKKTSQIDAGFIEIIEAAIRQSG